MPTASTPRDPRPALPPLQATERTTITRGRNRAVTERAGLLTLLDDALVAHVGIDTGEHPLVLPCALAVDPDGPDEAGTLYLHGSVGAGWVRSLAGDPQRSTLCVTVTELDGLVVGRSAFHHSMNYRCAVVIGRVRLVEDEAEKVRALDLIVDHMVPGRTPHLRPSTRKELAATAVLAVSLAEASMKERQGPPGDEPEDVEAGGWGGHVPIHRVAGVPITAPDSDDEVPAHVVQRAAALGAAPPESVRAGSLVSLES